MDGYRGGRLGLGWLGFLCGDGPPNGPGRGGEALSSKGCACASEHVQSATPLPFLGGAERLAEAAKRGGGIIIIIIKAQEAHSRKGEKNIGVVNMNQIFNSYKITFFKKTKTQNPAPFLECVLSYDLIPTLLLWRKYIFFKRVFPRKRAIMERALPFSSVNIIK